jgi:hypothetical protein
MSEKMIASVEKNGCRRYVQTGLNYYDFMPQFAAKINCQKYFEVGVNLGKSLRLIDAASVGVDPQFGLRADVMGKKPSLHLFQMTSDDFFSQYNLTALLGGSFDLAFLDGMHQFEYLLRDFIATEAYSHEKSAILLHDCFPINAEMTERERGSKPRVDKELAAHWTGDVWKLIPILRTYRPELQLDCLNCPPTGMAVVRGLDASSKVLAENYDRIVKEYMEVELNELTIADYFQSFEFKDASSFLERMLP